MVAGTVTWALDTWKKVEEIRKVRADVRKLELENAATIADQLEKEIEDKVKLLVDAEVKMILGKRFEEEGRAQEQRVDLTQVLGLVLDQVQKGVTIQVRLGPPPPADGPDVAPAVKTRSRQFAELAQVRQKLSFPRFSEEPLTFLSRPANDDKGSGGTE
ncbi:hypothetical protein [Rhodovarius sp.]|uniref:hypothetical protein n=1 Tax=Rhodovarius sp. TaxID=2972673 RepID=UPI0034A59C3A